MRKTIVVLISFVTAALVAGTSLQAMQGGPQNNRTNPNPGVLPPHGNAYGQSLGEWSANWWQWALGAPADTNPILDTTGEHADVNQSGPVWFLAGTFGGHAVREVTIPSGKSLLFPLINFFFINCLDEDYTPEEMTFILDAFAMPLISEVHCTVNGVPLEELFDYRATSPAFDVTLPANHVVDVGCSEPLPAGTYEPLVSDGYWLLHRPLPEGEHVITFGGTISDPDTGTIFNQIDATYLITVVDEDDD